MCNQKSDQAYENTLACHNQQYPPHINWQQTISGQREKPANLNVWITQVNIPSQLIFKDSFKKIICSWLQGLIWLSLHFLADWGWLWCSASGLRRSRYPCRGLTDALYCHCCYWKLLGLSMDLWKKQHSESDTKKKNKNINSSATWGKNDWKRSGITTGFGGPRSLTQKESDN